jgi:hypothetical protein
MTSLMIQLESVSGVILVVGLLLFLAIWVVVGRENK